MTSRSRVPALLAVLAVGFAAGCGGSDDGGGGDAAATAGKTTAVTAPAAIAAKGKLRICTDPTYPPVGFMQGTEYVGFDMDIARDMAESMGVEAEFVQTGFDGIVAAVQADKCDALMAGMNVTPEREQQIAFVRYGKTGHSMMVKKGRAGEFEALEDLSGKNVAVQVGTTQKDALDEENVKLKAAGKPEIDVITFPKDTDAAAALQAGRVDVYFADGPPVGYYVKRNPDAFEVAASNLTSTPIGIGLDKDNAELRAALQEAIDQLYSNGRMTEIFEEWNVPDVALEGKG